MSKRPTNSTGVLSRMSGLSGYLRDRPIWVKLGLIMMVPTLATIVVGFSALLTNIGAASDADRARVLANLSADSGSLVHNLQDERAAALMVLDTQSQTPSSAKSLQNTYQSLFSPSDIAIRAYRQHRTGLPNLPAAFSTNLDTIDTALSELPATRMGVVNGSDVTLSEVLNTYTTLIADLISIRDSSAQLAGDATLNYEMRAAAALARYKESASQERTVGLQTLLEKQQTPVNQQAFIGTLTAQTQALTDYRNVATNAQQRLLSQTLTGPDVRETQVFEDDFRGWTPGLPGVVPDAIASADDWDDAFVGVTNLLRRVEQQVDGEIVADAVSQHNRVQSQVLVEAGLLLGLVLVAVLIAWFVARSMNRSLRELRHGALAVAQYGLPQAVARLRDPTLSSSLSPQQMALQIAEPLPVRSKDEFGQVTEAFNAVHLEAVRTAAEQASLRSSVSTMFVNLARRSQILVDRLIGHLDRLERGEEDPDRLAELFQLDHLATRMRRNDENLLVLAGADSTRVQREPAALIDVLRAAQSEVEHYTRIEFGVVDRDIEVGAHAVNDLVHLVAELFDNATAFSPPDSTVIVEARRVGDRAVLYVEDHGIGISPDQLADLNERLATPPEVDVAVSRMMGLVVVARLATRHGVKVELRPSNERGTIADVLLPISVLVPRALTGRPTGPVPVNRDVPPPRQPEPPRPPQPRPAFGGSPLALESGPTPAGPVPAGAGSFGGPGAGGGNLSGFASMDANAFAGGGLGTTSGAPHGARQLPAWSDLTGAVNGSNGADLFNPRRPDNPGGNPLPQRRAGDGRPDNSVPPEQRGPATPRAPEAFQRPDRTDAFRPRDRDINGAPSAGPPTPYYGPMDAIDADVVEDRPRPAGPPPPAAPPPPAWPPVAPGAAAPVSPPPEDTKPPVPEELAAALDITSEMPRIRTDADRDEQERDAGWNGPSSVNPPVVPVGYTPPPFGAPPAAPVSPPPAPQRGLDTPTGNGPTTVRVNAYPDETMELPIFRELESAWFRSREADRSAGNGSAATETPTGPAPTGRPEAAVPETSIPTDQTSDESPVPVESSTGDTGSQDLGTTSTPSGARMPMPEPTATWQTAADRGWSAAQAAADPEVVALTEAGLPKRVPMAQLVPGGVEKATTSANRRSPEQVRGLLSAYHRGVQRGRTRNGEDAKAPDTSTSTGHPHGGKEQE